MDANAKEKAIKYCKDNKLIVPFFSKKVNRVVDEALDIAIRTVFVDLGSIALSKEQCFLRETTAFKKMKIKHKVK